MGMFPRFGILTFLSDTSPKTVGRQLECLLGQFLKRNDIELKTDASRLENKLTAGIGRLVEQVTVDDRVPHGVALTVADRKERSGKVVVNYQPELFPRILLQVYSTDRKHWSARISRQLVREEPGFVYVGPLELRGTRPLLYMYLKVLRIVMERRPEASRELVGNKTLLRSAIEGSIENRMAKVISAKTFRNGFESKCDQLILQKIGKSALQEILNAEGISADLWLNESPEL